MYGAITEAHAKKILPYDLLRIAEWRTCSVCQVKIACEPAALAIAQHKAIRDQDELVFFCHDCADKELEKTPNFTAVVVRNLDHQEKIDKHAAEKN